MDALVLLSNKDLNALTKKRSGESKFGEHVQILPNSTNIYDDILDLDVTHVIFGIKEDIGVFANYGTPGAANAWDATLKVLLNIQNNEYTNPKKVLILGHLEYPKSQEKLKTFDANNKKDITKARRKVEKIDKDVSLLISKIVSAGKIPVVIGGGHNNAYGNIKGSALGLGKPINAINFDAHCDFRKEEGRHSGNGFSYAFNEGFLENYFIFGLHENYTSEALFKTLNKLPNVKYNTYENLKIRRKTNFNTEIIRAKNHICNAPFGIEIDCDAIENIPSSAMTPSGFSANKARAFVNEFGAHKNATYLHICEAAPTKDTETLVGKLITYLITDFLRARHL